jgi:non-specific serine/threonine protein kinase
MLVTVRDFALEKLAAAGELALAQNLFADYVTAMAEAVMPEFPLGPTDGEFSFDIVGVDREAALAALDWLQSSGQHEKQLRLAVLLAPHWFARGALRDARSHLQRALAAAPDGELDDRLRATVALGMVAIQQGQFAYGEQQLLDALALACERDSDTWIGQANFSLGVLEQDRGAPDRAIPYFDNAHRIFEASGNEVFAAIGLNNLGLVTARNGDPQAGLEILDRARQRHAALGFAFGSALADRYAGQILLQIGDTGRARERLQTSIQLEPDLMQGWHVANAIETLAMLDLQKRAYGNAAVLAAGAARLREEIGVPLEPALSGEWQRFLADLRATLPPAELDAATAQGRSLTIEELIRRAVSPAPLGEAASPLNIERRPEDLVRGRLTPREIEVLRLIVDGKSNVEIADALFISPRTVSVHVTHILEKLGVENRSAAVAYILRSGAIIPSE